MQMCAAWPKCCAGSCKSNFGSRGTQPRLPAGPTEPWQPWRRLVVRRRRPTASGSALRVADRSRGDFPETHATKVGCGSGFSDESKTFVAPLSYRSALGAPTVDNMQYQSRPEARRFSSASSNSSARLSPNASMPGSPAPGRREPEAVSRSAAPASTRRPKPQSAPRSPVARASSKRRRKSVSAAARCSAQS